MPTITDDRARSLLLHALIALLAVAWWTTLSPPDANDLVGGDEGYYGVMARNVLAAPAQWPVPSLSPLGPAGDKPPMLAMLIGASLRLAGAGAGAVGGAAGGTAVGNGAITTPAATGAVRWPSIVGAFVMLLALARLGRRVLGTRGGTIALLVLASLPWFADAARVAAAESPLTALGLVALAVLAGAADDPSRRRTRAAFAGLLLGLAFLCKLWLVALVALPALALLGPLRDRGAVLALVGMALVPPLVHLGALAALRPDLFAHWWQVVFGFSLQARASGSGFAAYWFHGPFYYPAMLGRAFLLWAPFVLLGVIAALRTPAAPASRLTFAALAGLALLCSFRVQSGGYAFPLVPLLALVAAAGASWALQAPRWWRALAIAGVSLATLGGGVRIAQRLPERYHRPGYREIAALLAPRAAAARARVTFVLAPEAPVFAFALDRPARGWDTPYDPWTRARFDSLASDTSLRAFVVDTRQRFYGGWPGDTTLAWLETHTHEVTAEVRLPGRRALEGIRVFVRD